MLRIGKFETFGNSFTENSMHSLAASFNYSVRAFDYPQRTTRNAMRSRPTTRNYLFRGDNLNCIGRNEIKTGTSCCCCCCCLRCFARSTERNGIQRRAKIITELDWSCDSVAAWREMSCCHQLTVRFFIFELQRHYQIIINALQSSIPMCSKLMHIWTMNHQLWERSAPSAFF